MRQRALQKKLAKVEEATQSQAANENNIAEAKPATPSTESPEASSGSQPKMTAKALARQRLLKKKQVEAQKKAGVDTSSEEKKDDEAEKARLAAEAEKKKKEKEEEERKKRAEEESRKLRAAKMAGGMEILSRVMQKIISVLLSQVVVSWVENLGDDLALLELAEEELVAEEEAAAELLAEDEEVLAEEEAAAELLAEGEVVGEEGLDEELEFLADAVSEVDVSQGESAEVSSLKEKVAKQKEENKRLKLELRDLESELMEANEANEKLNDDLAGNKGDFLDTNKELAAVQRDLLSVKSQLAKAQKGNGTGNDKGSSGDNSVIKEQLWETNKDLQAAQRQILALKSDISKGGQSSGGGGKESEKLRASISQANKDLSTAQYTILNKQEQFKSLADLLEELQPHIDLKDKKVKKIIKKFEFVLDEALEASDDESH